MKAYRYQLASNRFPKITCPACGAKKHWQRYYDTITGEVLPNQYGCCDNLVKCGKSLNPYNDGYAKMIAEKERGNNSINRKFTKPIFRPQPSTKPELVFIPHDIFASTRHGYEQNVFIQNLRKRVPYPFDSRDIERVIAQYHLGTICNGYRAGGVTFPFIDIGGNVRAIQLKQFDQTNHTKGTDFLHSILEKQYAKRKEPIPNWLAAYIKQGKPVSCLFGEHLLIKFPQNPIALVEAPKTAILGTLYFGFPDNTNNLLWLAVYNLSSLSLNKCKALKGRNVVLIPDLSKDGHAFRLWESKAKEFNKALSGTGTRFRVDDFIESRASIEQREDGADIADILIQFDWRKFRPKSIQTITEKIVTEAPTTPKDVNGENSESSKETFFNTEVDGYSCSQSQTNFIDDSPKAKFKSAIVAEALQTGYANCDKWFDVHNPDPEDAWSAIIELFKLGFNIEPETKIKPANSPQIALKQLPSVRIYKDDWTKEIDEFEDYFSAKTLPSQPFKLNEYTEVFNAREFVNTQIEVLRANNGNKNFLAGFDRLHQLV